MDDDTNPPVTETIEEVKVVVESTEDSDETKAVESDIGGTLPDPPPGH